MKTSNLPLAGKFCLLFLFFLLTLPSCSFSIEPPEELEEELAEEIEENQNEFEDEKNYSPQELVDKLINIQEIDQGFIVSCSSSGKGGVYTNITLEEETSTNVIAWKGFGNNTWNTPNLFIDNIKDNSKTWFASEGKHPQVIDRGNGDKYVRFRNGPSIRYGTDPGQINPAIKNPIDIISVFRIYPHPNREVDGFIKFTDIENNWEINLRGFLKTNISGGLFNRVYLRFTVDASGYWEVRLNNITKATPDASGNGYTLSNKEHTIGSNGHPAEEHFYFRAFNFQPGGFNQNALSEIQSIFTQLWPLGKPKFPYDNGYGLTWNASKNEWSVNEGDFRGGNGEKGTYEYAWYYWNRLDTSQFSAGNKIEEHALIPGATSKTLNRDDISSLYTHGASPGSGDIWVLCIRTPKDSDGVEGEKISSTFIIDNR